MRGVGIFPGIYVDYKHYKQMVNILMTERIIRVMVINELELTYNI